MPMHSFFKQSTFWNFEQRIFLNKIMLLCQWNTKQMKMIYLKKYYLGCAKEH